MTDDSTIVLLANAVVEKKLNKLLTKLYEDKGIVGPKGEDGKDGLTIKGDKGDRGEPGATVVGPRGPTGPKGDPGKDGKDGKDGVSKVGSPGPKGDPGKSGKDGKGITNIAITPDGSVVVQYSDGKAQNIGQAQINNITNVSGGGGLIPDHYIINNVAVVGSKLTITCNNNKKFEVTLPSGGGGTSAWGGITGTLSDQTDLQTALNGKSDTGHTHSDATTSVSGFMSGSDKTKLNGIASGATANSSDATLLTRANHTGTQLSSTISDFNTAALTAAPAETPTTVGNLISGATGKPTPIDADSVALSDSAASGILKKLSWANIKATLKSYFDPFYAVGGSTTQLQYNNAGVFSGASSALIEGDELRLPAISTPTTPAANGAKIYGKSFAGRIMPTFLDPEGIERVVQETLQGRNIFITTLNNNTALSAIGGSPTVVGATHVQTIASANPWQAIRRIRLSTTAIAANASGTRTAYTQWFLGNAAGFGGFYFHARFGMNINLNGGQKFIGLCASTGILAGNPSALLNMIGVGYDAADASTGNWFLMRNDGSGVATKVDLGANAARNTTDGFDLTIYAKPNASEISVRIVNIVTGVVVLNTSYTTDIPAVNTGLAFKCDVQNGAVASIDNIEHGTVYIRALQ